MARWKIFCEESGDKGIPWKAGSSHHYVITAIVVKEEDEQQLIDIINTYKYKVLRMNAPLEWKKLKTRQKYDDKLLSRFLRKLREDGPEFYVSNVVCNKHETNGPGFVDRNIFMNYLYGLIFKRISWFLNSTNSSAELIIDRNTDPIAQDSLRNYLSDVARYQTGTFPRYSKPHWINPEENPALGLADFISGISLKSLINYHESVDQNCKTCAVDFGIYTCQTSNFDYKRSYKQVIDWNYGQIGTWNWNGLLYHPYDNKDNYRHLFMPQ